MVDVPCSERKGPTRPLQAISTRAAPQWTPERRAALSVRMKEQNRLRRGKRKPRGLKALRAALAPEQSRIVLVGDQWVLIPADKARVAIPGS